MHNNPLHQIYRREGDWQLIEIRLERAAQLLNSLDPSPFRERDLDADAAQYLISAMRELHGHQAVKLVIWLPPGEIAAGHGIADSIHHYFHYLDISCRQKLRDTLQRGRSSLVIGLLFLFLCMLLSQWVFTGEHLLDRVLGEGFLIIGWVAMWRPLDLLLYAWWPQLAELRLYRRMQELPVEIRTYPPHHTGSTT